MVFPTASVVPADDMAGGRGPASMIVRGAGWAELWRHFLTLWVMALTLLTLATLEFQKQLT